MLIFFRKYQKFFFFVTAIVMVTSFVFMGASTAINESQPSKVDRVIGQSIDGSDMRLLEIAALSHFLGSDRDDLAGGGTPNLFNDGVVKKDLLSTGIAEILVRESYDLLKESFSEKLQKMKTYRGYEHPEAPFLTAKAVWHKVSPELSEQWTLVQNSEEVTKNSFGQIARLYQLQSALPAEWMRRILMMQEQQYKQWLRPDPRLQQEDLNIFGFHTLTDWFGSNFMDLMAEFIHNTAIAAKENGYTVSYEEAKGDIRRIFTETSKKLQEANFPGSLTYNDQLHILGLDESEAVHVWQKVMLFRRYFQDMSQSVFVDKLAQTEFAAVAKERAIVDLYQWPETLKINSAQELLALQTYINAVAPKSHDSLALPTSYSSVAEVVKKAPELVATVYSAKVFAVDKREAALRAPLKEVWQFETETATWDLLKNEFSFLQPAKTVEDRFKQLDQLQAQQRVKVDSYARRLLVDKHPEWVRGALDGAEGKTTQLVLSAGAINMPHVSDPARLGSLFEGILDSPETSLVALNQFESGDGVFRFENIEKTSEPSIKTFKEALADGSLHRIVEKKLRAKLPGDKSDKDFEEMKEDLAIASLKDVKLSLEKESIQPASIGLQRMIAVANRARADLMDKKNEDKWLPQAGESALTSQFKLDRFETQISRSSGEQKMNSELFTLDPEQWASVHATPDGQVAFAYLKNREISADPVSDKLTVGKEKIGADMQHLLAEKIFARMQLNRAVIIPIQTE